MRACSGTWQEDEGTVTCQELTLERDGWVQVPTGACCSRCSQVCWTKRRRAAGVAEGHMMPY